MEKRNLYRYDEEDGSVTITQDKRQENDTPYKERLVADDGYILTDGEVETVCVDVDFVDENKWSETLIEESESELNGRIYEYYDSNTR